SAAAVIGMVAFWAGWWSAVPASVTSQMTARSSVPVFFVGQMGKYVPGSVWPALIQAGLGRRYGVAPALMLASWTYWAAVLVAVGALMGSTSVVLHDSPFPWPALACAAAAGAAALVILGRTTALSRVLGW